MKKLLALFGIVSIASAAFSAPTANEDFVVAEDARTYTNAVAAAKEYTDAAIAAAEPDFSTGNTQLVATIEATAPAPGNYAAVSNAAMTALHSETDPTVPAWAKGETPPLPPDYATVSNRAMTALQSFTETDPTVPEWAKAPSAPLPPDYATVSNRAMTALQSFTETDPHFTAWADAHVVAGGSMVDWAIDAMYALKLGDGFSITYSADNITAATNDLWQAIESIEPAPGPSAPCPVASRSWNRPGEWTIDYAPIMAPQSSEFIDLFTDSIGIVFSNVTRTASRGLTAQIYSESLDPLGEDAPPALASIIVSDGGSAAGDIVTVPTSGLYRVRGIAMTGAAREIAVSFA
ncbi:MAG: hypothetical protein IKB52_02580, partial [Kiritimatiellae bacterium]|nr:hypothetical protein [Kiritimatiellia bacterium]